MQWHLRRSMTAVLFLAMSLCASRPASAATIELGAAKDNSILNDFLGDPGGGQTISNGQGPLFIGTLARSPFYRRSLLAFDVAGAIPAGSTIDSVELRLQLTAAGPNTDNMTVAIHRLLADWGEGASFAIGGTGSPAEPGDTTWQYRFFDSESWTTPGGDFAAVASGSASIDRTQGIKVWSSSPGMVADVQAWLDDPSANFGWLLKGPESDDLGSARRFDSREPLVGDDRATASPAITTEYFAPQLVVNYTVPEPHAWVLAGMGVLAMLAARHCGN